MISLGAAKGAGCLLAQGLIREPLRNSTHPSHGRSHATYMWTRAKRGRAPANCRLCYNAGPQLSSSFFFRFETPILFVRYRCFFQVQHLSISGPRAIKVTGHRMHKPISRMMGDSVRVYSFCHSTSVQQKHWNDTFLPGSPAPPVPSSKTWIDMDLPKRKSYSHSLSSSPRK